MNGVVVFAGGTGQRMNTKAIPKQFLLVHGKPIIIHTLEKFENNKNIDKIVVACLKDYINILQNYIKQFNLTKVVGVVAGGKTGQESIFNGLTEMTKHLKDKQDIVLIHDGVRPIIDDDLINKNIDCVKQNKSAITVYNAIETLFVSEDKNVVDKVLDRSKCFVARAPQSFYLKDIYASHLKAISENKLDFIDSASLMRHYGYKLYTVLGSANNIKITTPMDYYFFKAILDAKENDQINFL